jgi:hypothetical protein
MPIPLIVWGAAAAGAAYVTWANRKKISAYFESEDGRKLLGFLGKMGEGAISPQHNILKKSLEFPQLERREFFRGARARMSTGEWDLLIAYGKTVINPFVNMPQKEEYCTAVTDLFFVNDNG